MHAKATLRVPRPTSPATRTTTPIEAPTSAWLGCLAGGRSGGGGGEFTVPIRGLVPPELTVPIAEIIPDFGAP